MAGMTVGELIEILEDFDENAEVRLAFQPSWPLQYDVGDVQEVELSASGRECSRCEGEGEVDDEDDPTGEGRVPCPKCDEQETVPVVFIGEGGQVREAPYLPGAASIALGWREGR
jgi:hypothetical protein